MNAFLHALVNTGKGLLTNIFAAPVPVIELAYALGYIDETTRNALLAVASSGIFVGRARAAVRPFLPPKAD